MLKNDTFQVNGVFVFIFYVFWMNHSFMIKSLLCFSSVAFLISVASAGSITLKANTTTPAIGEKVDIQIELPSDYK